ncbi:MAG: hypothetical protein ACRDGA_10665, partial [Bacteroidota bacterium]
MATGETVSTQESPAQIGPLCSNFGVQLTPSPSNPRGKLQLLQQLALQDKTQHSISSVSNIGPRKHGSAPLQIALMRQMQRTHGNRAVQRLIQQKVSSRPVAGKIPSPTPEMAELAPVSPASSPQPNQDAKAAPEAAVQPETQPSPSGIQAPSDKPGAGPLAAPPEDSSAGPISGKPAAGGAEAKAKAPEAARLPSLHQAIAPVKGAVRHRAAGERAREGGGGEAGGAVSPSLGGAERPKTPDEDPRFQAFKGQTRATAAKTKTHAPAGAKAAEAQADLPLPLPSR